MLLLASTPVFAQSLVDDFFTEGEVTSPSHIGIHGPLILGPPFTREIRLHSMGTSSVGTDGSGSARLQVDSGAAQGEFEYVPLDPNVFEDGTLDLFVFDLSGIDLGTQVDLFQVILNGEGDDHSDRFNHQFGLPASPSDFGDFEVRFEIEDPLALPSFTWIFELPAPADLQLEGIRLDRVVEDFPLMRGAAEALYPGPKERIVATAAARLRPQSVYRHSRDLYDTILEECPATGSFGGTYDAKHGTANGENEDVDLAMLLGPGEFIGLVDPRFPTPDSQPLPIGEQFSVYRDGKFVADLPNGFIAGDYVKVKGRKGVLVGFYSTECPFPEQVLSPWWGEPLPPFVR